MYGLIDILLLMAAYILISAVISAHKAHIEKRRGNAAPFRDHLGSECERYLQRQSALDKADDRMAQPHVRFALVYRRDIDLVTQFRSGANQARWIRERD